MTLALLIKALPHCDRTVPYAVPLNVLISGLRYGWAYGFLVSL